MNAEIYVRESEKGIARQLGAEVIDEWKGGRRIRSEEPLKSLPFVTYYVAEGGVLVAVELGEPSGEGPYDYAAEIDTSDTRPLPDFEMRAP